MGESAGAVARAVGFDHIFLRAADMNALSGRDTGAGQTDLLDLLNTVVLIRNKNKIRVGILIILADEAAVAFALCVICVGRAVIRAAFADLQRIKEMLLLLRRFLPLPPLMKLLLMQEPQMLFQMLFQVLFQVPQSLLPASAQRWFPQQ